MTKLIEYLKTIKSKNAGPFEYTIDLYFKDEQKYEEVKDSEKLNIESISDLYNIPKEDMIGVYEIDRMNVIKVSMQRPIPSGDLLDPDIAGSQQHTRIINIAIN